MAIVRNGKKSVKRTEKAQELDLTIQSLSHEAHGVGRHDNKVVFVPGALPGEEVKVRLQKQQRHFSQAQLLSIEKASEHRVEPNCPHFERCGACQLQHLASAEQLPYKQENLHQQLTRQLKLNEIPWQPPIESDGFGYRRRARLGVRYRKQLDEIIIGFREEANKHLTAIDACPVLEPLLSALITPMQACISQLNAKAVITQMELIASDQGPIVVLRHLKALQADDQNTLKAFAKQHECLMYLQGDESLECVYPEVEMALSYSVSGFELEFQVKDFIQGNAQVNQKMVELAATWLDLKPDETLLDLFAGIGNFSIPLAPKVTSLLAVEGVGPMVERIKHNAQRHNMDNITAMALNLDDEELLFRLPKADAIILDPPRTGAATLMPWLSKQKSRILYIACEPSSLVRDAQPLLDAGFRIEKITVMDMFPQTKHVESMALFVKD
ncbi:23S rRNA (uracil(1939)-C(5))-methyltransferase RlmD [Bermanella sp. WJH001]|uniref:23S rRNA (uracil(1939)-C(5))-methyltransferase RlmD n=1 Tax=Bermanella sp. WJH001 TaxID=3048005 RepID=UPI0024BDD738|nr:23S rRNA (uracil(1939)-C(5))-methyltransferase RlmD [Bermanella sp. WJH001]MDJ1537478.1 23S rRNA (uracil(1939)-C(5))-methyltransferase RlmD [Bermanella sp. WJH001]